MILFHSKFSEFIDSVLPEPDINDILCPPNKQSLNNGEKYLSILNPFP